MLFCMFDDYFLDICDGDRERERDKKTIYIYTDTFVVSIGRSIQRAQLF